jgi:hypothetical protein
MSLQDEAPLLSTASDKKVPSSSSNQTISQTQGQTCYSYTQIPYHSSGSSSLPPQRNLPSAIRSTPPQAAAAVASEGEEAVAAAVAANFAKAWRALLISFAGAGCYSLAAAVLRPLRTWSMFDWVGLTSATAWGWELTVSFGYVGQGMIMGPKTVWSMLAGAVAGERGERGGGDRGGGMGGGEMGREAGREGGDFAFNDDKQTSV